VAFWYSEIWLGMTIREVLERGVASMCTAAGVKDWLTLDPSAAAGRPDLLQFSKHPGAPPEHAPTPGPPCGRRPRSQAHWAVDASARRCSSKAEAVTPEQFFDAAVACYNRDRRATCWLRAVALLPDRGASSLTSTRAGPILPNFEAVACENPYPSRYFPDGNFNQVVMKAMFNGIRLDRVIGVAARANPELARMAADFAAERRAAGRPVPADLWMALAGTQQRGPTR
jgi:hypothetical protein